LGLKDIKAVEEAVADVDTGEIKYIAETLKRDTCKDQKEALVEVYRRLRPGDLVTPDTAQDLIFNMFFNFDRYDLSKVGRWKTWLRLTNLAPKDLNKEITKEERILSIGDLIEVVKEV
ncbi:MAG: DNA-directed RNA polymerase subunit beta, partial [Candidatus Staskawiczbacteria bacterium]|nr:DNA-directed RNA polymerase subunit beta [Candidatus Staskawiczbacteria bacterium]